jgi:hypothetical protein
MPSSPVDSLLDALSQVTDPRKRRGVRHPFTSILALTFLGLMCRQTEMAPLQRWAQDYWDHPFQVKGDFRNLEESLNLRHS